MESISIGPAAMGAPPPGVPVRDAAGRKLTPDVVRAFVLVAMQHARQRPERSFRVVSKGWGYPNAVIAPMFDYAPDNICLPLWEWMNKA